MTDADQTPRDKRTTLDLLIQGVHALRLDVEGLADRLATQHAALVEIQNQNAAILLALQDVVDGMFEHRARCTTHHPPPEDRAPALAERADA